MLQENSFEDKKVIVHYVKVKGKNKTLVNGLDHFVSNENQEITEKNVNSIVKALKKKLACGAVLKQSEENKDVKYIEVQGDHRQKIAEFLIQNNIVAKDNIVLKGA
jgi:translation initiation factor 1 (eIF-1/SUI1)